MRLRPLAFQYWMYVLRLLNAISGLAMAIIYHMTLSFVYYPYESGMPEAALFFVLWGILIINDIFMLTFDYARTDTYLGCVVVQGGISLVVLIIAPAAFGFYVAVGREKEWWIPVWAILLICAMIWSLCLLGTLSRATQPFREHIPRRYLWSYNTTDIFSGVLATPNTVYIVPRLSMTGNPRDVPLSRMQALRVGVCGVRGFANHLFFRRVSPAETKSYAFIRNAFAVISMAILVFRTATALLQAQNTFETRLQSRPCTRVRDRRDIQILVTDASGSYPGPNEISAYIMVPSNNNTLEACSQALRTVPSSRPIEQAWPAVTRFHVFSCNLSVPYYPPWSVQVPAFNIVARTQNGSALSEEDPPLVWLSNRRDYPEPSVERNNISTLPQMTSAVPLYLPPLQLRPGFHLEGEARFVTRRFMVSSAWRDLIANLKPTYIEVSLYPITTPSTSALANASVATATLRLTLQSSLDFLRSQQKFWESKRGWDSIFDLETCDFVEDYRSSTVVDVLGSIGGLFALLQAAHILLFGRPLFWGLSGAKLITPFGLIGACTLGSFRRRLREQYHRQPTADNPDTIQIGAFLRDFVIDFGPAEVEPDQESQALPRRKLLPEGNKSEIMDNQVRTSFAH